MELSVDRLKYTVAIQYRNEKKAYANLDRFGELWLNRDNV